MCIPFSRQVSVTCLRVNPDSQTDGYLSRIDRGWGD